MRWSPLRLTQKRWKAAYIALLTLLIFDVSFSTVPSSEVFGTIIVNLLILAGVFLGTRIFRGKNELLLAPRPWWRMTARPKAGFLLGAYWALGLIPLLAPGSSPVAWLINAAVNILLAVFYVRSSILLRRSERRTVVASPD